MIRRLFWFVLGAGAGAAAVLKGQAEVRRRTEAMRPDALAATAARSVRDLGTDLRTAAVDGRTAMRDREAQLQQVLADRKNQP